MITITRSASGCAIIIKQVILPSGHRGEFIHGLLHNARDIIIKRIYGFAGLEIDIRILGRTANNRIIRGQPGADDRPETKFSSIMARISSKDSCSILATSWEVRNPSKKCINGMRDSKVASCAIKPKSMTSCTEHEQSMAKPVMRADITS